MKTYHFDGEKFRKISVRNISDKKEGQPQSVVVNKEWLEFDVTQNGVRGMKIHVDFNVKNMKGKQGKVIVYFEYPKGTGLKDTNGKYCTKGGDVCVSEEFTPSYDNSHYSDFDIFMPIDEIHMKKGKLTYYCDIRVLDLSSGKFLNGDTYLSFTGEVDTEPTKVEPRTWRDELPEGGYREYVQHEDGSLTTKQVQVCFACRGSKICQGCGGFGGRYSQAYGGMYYPCTMCMQSGRCSACKGEGSITTVATTDAAGNGFLRNSSGYTATGNSGGTIVTDPNGRSTAHPSGGSNSGRSGGSSSRDNSNDYVETVEYAPNYTGEPNDVWCEKCQKYSPRHSHIRNRVR